MGKFPILSDLIAKKRLKPLVPRKDGKISGLQKILKEVKLSLLELKLTLLEDYCKKNEDKWRNEYIRANFPFEPKIETLINKGQNANVAWGWYTHGRR